MTWTRLPSSRGQPSLRNARMSLHWSKKHDTRVHLDLEVKGLHEHAFRASVPIEANENTTFTQQIPRPSLQTKGREKYIDRQTDTYVHTYIHLQEEHRDFIYKALIRFRQGWEQRVAFKIPQQVLGKKHLRAKGGPITSHCWGRQGLPSKTDPPRTPISFLTQHNST